MVRAAPVTRAALVAVMLALAAASCGGRPGERVPPPGSPGVVSPTGSPPGVRVDRRNDALLAAMAPSLEEWGERWRAVVPGFTLDSLYREVPRPFRPQYTRGLTPDDLERARFFGVVSPDSSRIAEADWYRQIIDGQPELWGEPDSAPALVDVRADSFHVLTTIGTVGGFEEAFWIDRDRFAITGYGERQFEPWAGGGDLWVYDLVNGTLGYYHTPDVSQAAYQAYLGLARKALKERFDVRRRA